MLSDASFGFLTLATRADYLKAIGLSLSLEVSNPGVPRAVACSEDLFPLLEPYFDFLVPEVKGLKGFAHKVYLDVYTPFSKTMFFDSDVLVFQRVEEHIKAWPAQPYNACGKWLADGVSAFGLDRAKVAKRLGVSKLVCIDGAGHAYFDKLESFPIFERARYITEKYDEFGDGAKYADEDVINMVMTEFGLEPSAYGKFFSRYLSAKPGSLKMDASRASCSFISAETGEKFEPCMMHFAADEAPFVYTIELWRLFRANNVSARGLWSLGLGDIYRRYARGHLSRIKAGLKNLLIMDRHKYPIKK